MRRAIFAIASLLALAACATEPPVAAPAAPVLAPPPMAAATSPTGQGRAFPVFFESWSAALDEPAAQGLVQAAQLARDNPRVPILVTGFASPAGSGEANRLLSALRARVVADKLTEAGVAAGRIRVAYRGATPGFESLESRRVEVRVDPAAAERAPARRR